MQGNRRLPARIWGASTGLSRRTRLLIAHFTARLSAHDPLSPLQDAELEALASPEAAAWPIARAVTIRLLTEPSPALLRALADLGPATAVDLPRTQSADAVPDAALGSAVLGAPARYPGSWVAAAERGHSLASEESSMERDALKEEWVPKVPRLLSADRAWVSAWPDRAPRVPAGNRTLRRRRIRKALSPAAGRRRSRQATRSTSAGPSGKTSSG